MEEQHVSVRFKYGIHTIYMFVDLTESMSKVKTDLLEMLRERYPSGLTIRHDDPEKYQIPETDDNYLALGTLAIHNNPYAGWKKLKFEENDNAGKVGLKKNSILAFTFVDEQSQEPLFLVEWPAEEPEEEEEQASG